MNTTLYTGEKGELNTQKEVGYSNRDKFNVQRRVIIGTIAGSIIAEGKNRKYSVNAQAAGQLDIEFLPISLNITVIARILLFISNQIYVNTLTNQIEL